MKREKELAYLFSQYPIVFYSIKSVPEWAKVLNINLISSSFKYNSKLDELIVVKDFGYYGEA